MMWNVIIAHPEQRLAIYKRLNARRTLTPFTRSFVVSDGDIYYTFSSFFGSYEVMLHYRVFHSYKDLIDNVPYFIGLEYRIDLSNVRYDIHSNEDVITCAEARLFFGRAQRVVERLYAEWLKGAEI